MSERDCVKCGGPCKAAQPMTDGVRQQIAQNERDLEMLRQLRAHAGLANLLIDCDKTAELHEALARHASGSESRETAEVRRLLAKLLRGEAGHG
jgi:hypothetical protein